MFNGPSTTYKGHPTCCWCKSSCRGSWSSRLSSSSTSSNRVTAKTRLKRINSQTTRYELLCQNVFSNAERLQRSAPKKSHTKKTYCDVKIIILKENRKIIKEDGRLDFLKFRTSFFRKKQFCGTRLFLEKTFLNKNFSKKSLLKNFIPKNILPRNINQKKDFSQKEFFLKKNIFWGKSIFFQKKYFFPKWIFFQKVFFP